jgi:hypothetical protein
MLQADKARAESIAQSIAVGGNGRQSREFGPGQGHRKESGCRSHRSQTSRQRKV